MGSPLTVLSDGSWLWPTSLWRDGEGNHPHGHRMVANFNVLKFGAPSLARLPDGQAFVAFWCYEENLSIIRWFKFNVM